MKKITLLVLLASNIVFCQLERSSKMGQTTLDELKMTVYHRDSTATAVVLYEHANLYIDPTNDFKIRTDYYYRIKILDKSAFNLADVAIHLFKEKKLKNLKAITYNLSEIGTIKRDVLLDKDIFTTQENKNYKSKKYTLPNIKEGSVIEYSYSIISPYLTINDWYFQSDIPKIKSDFDAAILGNYKYNIRTIGIVNLDKDEVSINKKCVDIPLIGVGACAIYSYGMNDVPAFKEEDYMLSKKNYLMRLSFDLKSYTSFRGVVKNVATTWDKADKSIKNYFFNHQTSKKNYFKNKLPDSILSTENTLEKAKKVFSFVQNHYTWNENYWTSEDAKVKNAFDDKSGDVGEINLSLYNSLKAAEIPANLVVLSTRNNGIPTKLYPIIFDFNYVIIKTIIDGKPYFLDATDKFLPFGQLPTRTLNGEARVIDFNNDGYWEKLTPSVATSKNTVARMTLQENGDFTGNLVLTKHGYFASEQREKLAITTEENYLEEFENKYSSIEVEDYKNSSLENLNSHLKETFTIKITAGEQLENKIKIRPIFIDRLEENPFKLKERNYPVDFGFLTNTKYSLNLVIPENYSFTQIPKDLAISLPNKSGSFIFKIVKKENRLIVFVRLNLYKSIFSADEYFALKEFYKQIILSENSYITIEKKM
ncbi:hypothetical protein [Polaribacter sp.]|uniref:hypothetical protein n=1 Tax=Polaribacter sp. TaxID=1920175 RepID=UPI003EF7CC74